MTPEQLRVLADRWRVKTAAEDGRWHWDVREALRAAADQLDAATRLIRDFTDPDPCWFDHHGGCQAHGYLTLQPGQLCPHAEAKRDWLTADTAPQEDRDE